MYGLLRLEAGRLIVQWRVARQIDHVGSEIRSDSEMESVREVTVPLNGLAAVRVRSSWWRLGRRPSLVLTASDLRAFESIAGQSGLRLGHPAELVLPVRRADRGAAEEFAADLELALAEEALRRAEGAHAGGSLGPKPQAPHRLAPGENDATETP